MVSQLSGGDGISEREAQESNSRANSPTRSLSKYDSDVRKSARRQAFRHFMELGFGGSE